MKYKMADDESYLSLLTPENIDFVKKFNYKNYLNEYKVLDQLKEGSEPTFVVADIVNGVIQRTKKILKILNFSNKETINLVIDGFRSTWNYTSIQGDYKCYSDRFLCYEDMFISRNKDGLFSFCYVYKMSLGEDMSDWMVEKFQISSDYSPRFPPSEGEYQPIDFKTLVSVTYSLFSSLALLHQGGIYHRDIKLENIVVVNTIDDSLFLKLIDFDFSCGIKHCFSNPGTTEYAPISLLKGKKLKPYEWEFCDIVSAAITILRLYTQNKDIFQYNLDLIAVSEEFAYVIDNEYDFRNNYYSDFDMLKEEGFKDYMIGLLFNDLTEERTSQKIVEELEDLFGDDIYDYLIESYKRDKLYFDTER